MNAIRRCSGFTLVSAIFLLVVLAALGAYMITISGVQQATTNHAVIAARTYYAAKSGLEWAINRAVNTQTVATATPLACINTSFPDPSQGGGAITITITCTSERPTEGGGTNSPFNVMVITSIAEYGAFGNPDYARRRLEATVSNFYGPTE